MEQAIHPERSLGFRGDNHYIPTAENGKGDQAWVLHLNEHRAKVRRGRAPNPAVTITMGIPTFGRIISRDINPGAALMDDKLRIEGDFQVASRMGEMFARRGTSQSVY